MSAEELGRRVDETLTVLDLPDGITCGTSQPRAGWQGDPLVHVTLVLQDGVSDTPPFRELSRKWNLVIADALREALPDYWPLLTYRSESDQKEIDSGVAMR